MDVILLLTRDAANSGWLRRNAVVVLPRMSAERLGWSDPA